MLRHVASSTRHPPTPSISNVEVAYAMAKQLNLLPALRRQRHIHVAGTKGKGTTALYISRLVLDGLLQRQHHLGARGVDCDNNNDNGDVITAKGGGQVTAATNFGHPVSKTGGSPRVGLFTSPHLVDPRERILINGRMLPKRRFAKAYFDFLKRHDEAFDALPWASLLLGPGGHAAEPPPPPHPATTTTTSATATTGSQDERATTVAAAAKLAPPSRHAFFRFMWLFAIDTFEKEGVDAVVTEVGIGGRLDATNILPCPTACVITALGYDHMDILGHHIEQIAAEKAGIIKSAEAMTSLSGPTTCAQSSREHEEARATAHREQGKSEVHQEMVTETSESSPCAPLRLAPPVFLAPQSDYPETVPIVRNVAASNRAPLIWMLPHAEALVRESTALAVAGKRHQAGEFENRSASAMPLLPPASHQASSWPAALTKRGSHMIENARLAVAVSRYFLCIVEDDDGNRCRSAQQGHEDDREKVDMTSKSDVACREVDIARRASLLSYSTSTSSSLSTNRFTVCPTVQEAAVLASCEHVGRSQVVHVSWTPSDTVRAGRTCQQDVFLDGAHTPESMRVAANWFFGIENSAAVAGAHRDERREATSTSSGAAGIPGGVPDKKVTLVLFTTRRFADLFAAFIPYRHRIGRVVFVHAMPAAPSLSMMGPSRTSGGGDSSARLGTGASSSDRDAFSTATITLTSTTTPTATTKMPFNTDGISEKECNELREAASAWTTLFPESRLLVVPSPDVAAATATSQPGLMTVEIIEQRLDAPDTLARALLPPELLRAQQQWIAQPSRRRSNDDERSCSDGGDDQRVAPVLVSGSLYLVGSVLRQLHLRAYRSGTRDVVVDTQPIGRGDKHSRSPPSSSSQEGDDEVNDDDDDDDDEEKYRRGTSCRRL